MDYFEDTYIGRRRSNGRATPRFPIDLWNMHFRTINELMRGKIPIDVPINKWDFPCNLMCFIRK